MSDKKETTTKKTTTKKATQAGLKRYAHEDLKLNFSAKALKLLQDRGYTSDRELTEQLVKFAADIAKDQKRKTIQEPHVRAVLDVYESARM